MELLCLFIYPFFSISSQGDLLSVRMNKNKHIKTVSQWSVLKKLFFSCNIKYLLSVGEAQMYCSNAIQSP